MRTKLKKSLPEWVIQAAETKPLSSLATQVIKYDYEEFLLTSKRYAKNPKDISVVIRFLMLHPMFWKITDNDSHIITDNGLHVITVGVMKNKVIALEAGASSTGQYFYHDYHLDVYAKSMDKAYRKLAARIHSHYDEHGNLRDGRSEPNTKHLKRTKKCQW